MNLESAGLNVFKLKGKLEKPRKNIRLNYQKMKNELFHDRV